MDENDIKAAAEIRRRLRAGCTQSEIVASGHPWRLVRNIQRLMRAQRLVYDDAAMWGESRFDGRGDGVYENFRSKTPRVDTFMEHPRLDDVRDFFPQED